MIATQVLVLAIAANTELNAAQKLRALVDEGLSSWFVVGKLSLEFIDTLFGIGK
jgi:hypothetical protein